MSHLRKTYGGVVAVDDVSFTVAPNEIVGLLGPNGAGKTTTISMILGVLEPTLGEIAIQGCSLRRNRRQALQRTNFAAVYAPLPGNLTVMQNLRFFGRVYDVKDLNARIETVLQDYDLQRFRNTRCGVLSSGEQTRVSLAKAMLNQPQLLLLDEPTTGFDPAARRNAWQLVRSLRELGKTVLLTTHYLDEAQQLADRVAVIVAGEIVRIGKPSELTAGTRAQIRYVEDGREVVVDTDEPTRTLHELTARALAAGTELEALEVRRASLEDVYLQLVGEEEA